MWKIFNYKVQPNQETQLDDDPKNNNIYNFYQKTNRNTLVSQTAVCSYYPFKYKSNEKIEIILITTNNDTTTIMIKINSYM